MRRVILAVTSTVAVLVLLLGFKSQSAVTKPAAASAGTGTASGGATSGSSGSGGSGSDGSTGSTGSSGSSGSTGSSGSVAGTKTVTGDAADTRFGPVQVKLTATNGKITSIDAIEYPTDTPRDQEINSFAVPQLNQEAAAASNANIDIVSGATYTSEGYIQSLQSALDKLKS